MNVGLIHPYYLPVLGGVEKNLYEIASFLSAKGHNVTIITNQINDITINTLGSEDVKPIPSLPLVEKETNNITIIRYNLPFILPYFSFIKKFIRQPLHYSFYASKIILKIARLRNIEVLYAAEPPSYIALYLTRYLPNSRFLINSRKIAGIRSNTYITAYLRKKIAQKIFKSFDAVVISNVNTLLYEHLRTISPRNTLFIPNWVDTERFKPYNKYKAQHILGIDGYDKILLSVSRFVPEKGTIRVVKAFEKALKLTSNKKILLVLVGKGPLENQIKAYINNKDLNKHIKLISPFLYTDPRYPMLYSSSDIFIHLPSHHGLSNVVTEAMAAGVPQIIHSDVPGIPNVVARYLRRVSFSISEIAEAIVEGIECYDTKKGFEVRNIVEKYFSKKKLLPLFTKILLGY
ncbi:MAG: glycosyltransferase family 4 protein [Thermofilum sp.]|nr:glycosyltransferase family 4 protein [Thermofilum sp.]